MSSADTGLPEPPRNLRIVLEYDGTDFAGWERQKNGLGVQEVIESAIEKITRERTTVNGSGRTDAGVHALGQVASFTLRHRMAAPDLHRALNAVLPDDVSVLALDEVDLFFHARFSATSKLYRYRILDSRIRRPLERRTSWQLHRALDVDAMAAAAHQLVGRRDFTAFCKEAYRYDSCVRDLQRLDVRREGAFVVIDAAADGFLYNMVRILVGTLVAVGSGKTSIAAIEALLAGGGREGAGATVPACGLTLVEVFYP